MPLLQRLFLAAGMAGLLAGLLLTGVHAITAYPLIQQAEHFETGSHDHGGASHDQAHGEDEAWTPADGANRLFFSALSNLLIAFGLSLVICSLFHLFQVESWRDGLLWGAGGFVALHLAPAMGLPPVLPGMPEGALIPRQVWWWGTALATGSALVLLFRTGPGWTKLVAPVLLILPHLFGAPPPPSLGSMVPATLAAQFVTVSLATNALFWCAMGGLCAYFMTVFAQQPAPRGNEDLAIR